MNNVPNLDAMDNEDLIEFWKKHEGGKNYKYLFDDGFQGKKQVTAALANYAFNLAVAKRCRLDGNIDEAFTYDNLCDEIYLGLPSWALW